MLGFATTKQSNIVFETAIVNGQFHAVHSEECDSEIAVDEELVDANYWDDIACVDLISDCGEGPGDSQCTLVDSDSDSDVMVITCSPSTDPWHRMVCHFGMSTRCFQNMIKSDAPPIIFNLMKFMFEHENMTNEQDIDYLDMFAGCGRGHAVATARGLHAAKYDSKFDPVMQNMLLDTGFVVALQLARRCSSASASTWGPLCSSWIWLCRNITKRSKSQPLGPAVSPPRTQIWINRLDPEILRNYGI